MYHIRIDTSADSAVASYLRSISSVMILGEETTEDNNLHFHAHVETQIPVQTIRNHIRVEGFKGNKCYSVSQVKDKIHNIAYILKGYKASIEEQWEILNSSGDYALDTVDFHYYPGIEDKEVQKFPYFVKALNTQEFIQVLKEFDNFENQQEEKKISIIKDAILHFTNNPILDGDARHRWSEYLQYVLSLYQRSEKTIYRNRVIAEVDTIYLKLNPQCTYLYNEIMHQGQRLLMIN